ncbi:MAG: DUF6273 domain-containing protein [Lachnospiraceae bacterium]|nr:DUF6273 domain-containing protein [Lachnospiraceae bacterium]
MYCIKCGAKNDDDAKFCIACGEQTAAAPLRIDYHQSGNEVTTNPVVAKKKKDKLPFIMAGAVLLIGIMTFVIFFVSNASPEVKARKELKLANQYLDEMQYEMAIASYTKAIEIDPKNVEAYEGLANTYVAMADEAIIAGDIGAAIEYYENAIVALDTGEAETGDKKLIDLKTGVEEKKKDAEEQKKPIEAELYPEDEANDEDSDVALTCMDAEEILQANVGDTVTYGAYGITYRQYEWDWNDNNPFSTEISRSSNSETPIEWIVLTNDGNSVTLLSKFILDTIPYNYRYIEDLSWERSDIRKWLNNDFYEAAFSENEKEWIQTTVCENDGLGDDTQDKVYLLSVCEIENFFGIDDAGWEVSVHDGGYVMAFEEYEEYCNSTSGEILSAVNPSVGSSWCWWLRTPYISKYGFITTGGAPYVNENGGVLCLGIESIYGYGVRPVIRIGL